MTGIIKRLLFKPIAINSMKTKVVCYQLDFRKKNFVGVSTECSSCHQDESEEV